MNKIIRKIRNKSFLYYSVLFFLFFQIKNVLAKFIEGDAVTGEEAQTNAFLGKAGFTQTTSIGSLVTVIIKAFLGLLGIIFIFLMVLAGYNWMTAAGDEQKVTKAKDTIRTAVIGLIIIIASYSITYFVLNALGGTGGPIGGGT